MNGQIGRRKSTASMPRCRGSPGGSGRCHGRERQLPARRRPAGRAPAPMRPGYTESATASSASRTGAPCGSRGRSEGEGGMQQVRPSDGGGLRGGRGMALVVDPLRSPHAHFRANRSAPTPFPLLPSKAEPSRSRAKSSLPIPPERSRAPFPFLPSEVEGLFRASARIHQPTRTTRKLSSSVARSPSSVPIFPSSPWGCCGVWLFCFAFGWAMSRCGRGPGADTRSDRRQLHRRQQRGARAPSARCAEQETISTRLGLDAKVAARERLTETAIRDGGGHDNRLFLRSTAC